MFVQLWRLLADRGEPVSVEQLAAAGGWPVAAVQAELDRQPGVDWHDDGRVAGRSIRVELTPNEVVAIAEEFEIGRRAMRELGWAAPSVSQPGL